MMTATERIQQLNARLASVAECDRKRVIEVWEKFRRDITESPPTVEEVASGLTDLRRTGEWDSGEAWLVMASVLASNELVQPLCEILDLEAREAPNENIVELLIELRDPASIPSLIKATNVRYDFDPTLQIPTKALEALCEIGTHDAIAHVEKVIASNAPIISQEAKLLLEAE